jgi:pimeloyl-ACP methyl ester carboxylesterase
MARWRRISRIAGISAGAAAAGVGAVITAERLAAHRLRLFPDPAADEPFGELRGREFAVLAPDGVPLHVEVNGPDDAPVTIIFCHGYALNQDSWHYQRRDLGGVARLVFWDQRGHGRSGRAPGPVTVDQTAGDLDAVIRSVTTERCRVILVGHSMGGMTIMALAEQHPELFAERVRGVALIGTSAGEVGRRGLPRPLLSKYNPLTRTVGDIAAWQPGLADWVRSAGGGVTRQAVRWLAFGDRSVPSSLVDFMVEMLAVTPVPVLTNFLPSLGTHNRFAALAGLRHSQVLVLSGDHDQLTPFSHAERIAEELPDAKLVRAFGAGHMVMLEQSDLVTDELAGLLRTCVSSTLRPLRRWRNK